MWKPTVLALGLLASALIAAAGDERRIFPCIDLAGIPDVGASSRLEEGDDWKKYHESNLFDGNVNTAWVEGVKGYGIGEKVWFALEPGTAELVVTNGYARNASLFAKNARVKAFGFSLWAACRGEGMVSEIGPVFEALKIGFDGEFPLADTARPQKIALSVDWKEAARKLEAFMDQIGPELPGEIIPAYFAVLEIRDVYRGTHFEDTCVAEIDWRLAPDSAGPGGIRRKDLSGVWLTRKGADWESVVFAWNAVEQKYTAFLHDRLFDSGTWGFVEGRLVLESDGRGMIREYHAVEVKEGRLVLKDDAGRIEEYARE